MNIPTNRTLVKEIFTTVSIGSRANNNLPETYFIVVKHQITIRHTCAVPSEYFPTFYALHLNSIAKYFLFLVQLYRLFKCSVGVNLKMFQLKKKNPFKNFHRIFSADRHMNRIPPLPSTYFSTSLLYVFFTPCGFSKEKK